MSRRTWNVLLQAPRRVAAIGSLLLLTLAACATAANPVAQTLQAADGTTLQTVAQRVTVPVRHAAADGATIELATLRIRHPDADPDVPAHVLLAGGPGASGVELVRELARQGGRPLFDLLGGDLVGIDQRGTGDSLPNLDDTSRYALPLDQPGDPARWQPAMQEVAEAAVARQRQRGIELADYNTIESADDVDSVRRALGLERVVLWGRSYGSHLALAVLRRHPETVIRAVLANPEGPDHTFKRPVLVDAVIARFGARLSEDPKWKHRLPDLAAAIDSLLRRLEAKPQVVQTVNPETRQTVRVSIGRFDIEWLLTRMLSETRTMAMVPPAMLQLQAGDFRQAGAIIALHRSQLGVKSLMKQAMDASSGASDPRRQRITSEAGSALLGNAINFPLWQMQDAWGASDLGDGYRQPFASPVPVLLLAGDLDVRTPIENAHELAAVLGNASVVIIENGAHDFAMFNRPAIRDRLQQFLRGDAVDTAPIDVGLPMLPD